MLDRICPTPLAILVSKMKRYMLNVQMELSLAKANRRCSSAGRRRRGSRARWWFDQMRQVVDEASEWPSAEPEQTGDPTNARTSLAQERPIGRDTQIVPG